MHIVIDARPVADHFPGIGRYVYNLAAALAMSEQPHRLTLLYTPRLQSTRFDLAALARATGIALAPIATPPISAAEQFVVPLALRALHADLYHAPYYVRPYLGLPCPAVTTLYDTIPRRFPTTVPSRVQLLYDLLHRLAIRSSRVVLAISASARRDLIAAYSIAPQHIYSTPLAADPRFTPQPHSAIAALRARHTLPERYVLSLASNKPHKNSEALVMAWAIVMREHAEYRGASPRLVIAGHWDQRYPAARELVAQLGLERAVQFLPNIPEHELPALYSGAELFVFPSLYEGFGLPPLEALACGTPVVCGATSSLPEVVGQAALMVDTREATALAGRIRVALADAALRSHLREAGLKQAALFSWEQTAQATLAAYAAATSSRSDS
jgi:alpha-1,3-rhamnosyl/mannosyltransferase